MNLIDSFVGGRSIIPDSSSACKWSGAAGASSPVGQDASFGDVLSQVSKRDATIAGPSCGHLGADRPASFREPASARTGPAAIAECGAGLSDVCGADANGQNAEPPAAASRGGADRAYVTPPSQESTPFKDGGAGLPARLQALQQGEAEFSPHGAKAAHSSTADAALAGIKAAANDALSQWRADTFGADAPPHEGVAEATPASPPTHPEKTKPTSRADPLSSKSLPGSGFDPISTLASFANAASISAMHGECLGSSSTLAASAVAVALAPQSPFQTLAQAPERWAISPLGAATASMDLPKLQETGASASQGVAGHDLAVEALTTRPIPTSAAFERGPVKVAVLDQKTHLPPVVEIAPIHQIADRIVGEASSVFASSSEGAEPAGSSEAAVPGGEAGLPSQASPSVVKTLNLQLKPESLGAVTITMRLSGARLDVQVEAANADAVRLIGADKDRLAERLRSSGYAMDNLVVKISQSQVTQMQHGRETTQTHATDNQGGAQSALASGSQEGGSSADGRFEAQKDRRLSPIQRAEIGEDRFPGGGRGDAIYL